jgi:hypothetical protein
MDLTFNSTSEPTLPLRDFDLEQDPEQRLLALEARYTQLQAELAETTTQLRALRVAADLCPSCGGTGRRKVRGGLYGELQVRKCSCQDEI